MRSRSARSDSDGRQLRPARRPGPMMRRTALVVGTAVAAIGYLAGAAGQASADPSHGAARAGLAHQAARRGDYRRACGVTTRPGRVACMALVRTNVLQRTESQVRSAARPDAVTGYSPANLRAAYNLPSTGGSGQTVAVIDAYNDPKAASDLATYRTQWGLPPCTGSCFQQVNQNGQASPLPAAAGNSGWATEESLDIEMVSAICPSCHILLVEANSPTLASLGTAVNAAIGLGADYVSNSYGGDESGSDSGYDSSYFNHPGIAITASAGDDGYGVAYPAASRYVTAVGGTTLTTASNARGWTESVWGSASGGEGSGSGCSADDAKPSWQTDTGCARRTDNDVAADANPNTGVAIYDSYDQNGWLEVGGTSVGAPLIASVYALAGPPTAGSYPASYIYAHTSSLFDITAGADGSCGGSYLCTAKPGYDGPTGWGTPDGIAAFEPGQGGGGGGGNTVTVTSPGNQTTRTRSRVSLQISATDSASGQTLTYSATGLPSGLAINASTGLITGTPTTAGKFSVTVTAADGTGASGAASFSWTITGRGGFLSFLGRSLRTM
jgi:subtilase family serine protease